MTIFNEVDGEEVPGVPEDFQYFEHGYDWGGYAPDRNFLIGCDCAGNCSVANAEDCCIKYIEELTGFWYDKRVHFSHLDGTLEDNWSHLRRQGLVCLDTAHILLTECNVVSQVFREKKVF